MAREIYPEKQCEGGKTAEEGKKSFPIKVYNYDRVHTTTLLVN